MSSGHRWPDIQDYTLSQVILFHKAAVLASARERASNVIDVAVAFHAKQQDRTKYIKQLDKTLK